MCVCTRAREPPLPPPPRVLPPPVQRAGFHLSHLGKPNRRTLTLPRSTRKLGLGRGDGGNRTLVSPLQLCGWALNHFSSLVGEKKKSLGGSERLMRFLPLSPLSSPPPKGDKTHETKQGVHSAVLKLGPCSLPPHSTPNTKRSGLPRFRSVLRGAREVRSG